MRDGEVRDPVGGSGYTVAHSAQMQWVDLSINCPGSAAERDRVESQEQEDSCETDPLA